MKKKVIAALLATAMVTTALAGCTTNTNTGGTNATEAVTEEVAGEEAADEEAQDTEAKAERPDGEEVVLRVALWDYTNVSYYKEIFEAFEQENPGIKVEAVESPADQHEDLIKVKLAAKENLDVIFTKGSETMDVLVREGHILQLDDYMDTSETYNQDAYGGLVEAMEVDGGRYSIPFRKDNWIIYYNKDLFDAANVEYPVDGMTIEEYRELAKEMTSGEGVDKVYGAHVHTWRQGAINHLVRTGEFTHDGDDFANIIPYYETILTMQNDDKSIMDFGSLRASSTHYSGVFYNQQAAMLSMGTWFINMLLENADFNWGVVSLPHNDGIGNTQAVGGLVPVGVGAYAAHPEEAWKLTQFITGQKAATILAEMGILAGYTDAAIGEVFDSLPAKYPETPEGLSQYVVLDKYIMETPVIEKAAEINEIIEEQHGLILTNSVTAEDGIRELQERVDNLLGK